MKWGSWVFSLLLSGILLLSWKSEARVFDINKESFASYLRVNGGTSLQADNSFAKSSGTGMSFDKSVKYNYGYEFGFLYASRYLGVRFGIEVLRPDDLKDVVGSNAAGTSLYTFRSELSAVVPKMAFEFNLKQWSTSRWFLYAEAGQATVTLQNSYTFTTAGTTQFALADFREEGRGSVLTYAGGTGFETLLSDTTTIVFEAGYRQLTVNTLVHQTSVTAFGPTTVTKGDSMVNSDGSAREVNLNGAYAGLALRFYIK